MNPNFTNMEPDEIEVQITALLLGELSPEAAVELERMIGNNPQLTQLKARLEKTLDLVEAAVAQPSRASEATPVPFQLSHDRRSKLLDHLKTTPSIVTSKRSGRRSSVPWMIPMAAAASLMALAGVFFWRGWSDSPSAASELRLLGRRGEENLLALSESSLNQGVVEDPQDKTPRRDFPIPADELKQKRSEPVRSRFSVKNGVIPEKTANEFALSPADPFVPNLSSHDLPASQEVALPEQPIAAGKPLALGLNLKGKSAAGSTADQEYFYRATNGRVLSTSAPISGSLFGRDVANAGAMDSLHDFTVAGAAGGAGGRAQINLQDAGSFNWAAPTPPSGAVGGLPLMEAKLADKDAVDSKQRGSLPQIRLGEKAEGDVARKLHVVADLKIELGQKLQESLARDDSSSDRSRVAGAAPIPVPQPEVDCSQNAFSTFSLNVTDVSFKLAAASLQNNVLPDPGSIRTEEFINAFQYRDPEPAPGVAVAFQSERARYPFAHDRDILRLAVKTAAQGREAGRPLNLVLVLDNSGSMERADRVVIRRSMLTQLGRQLTPQDRISVITFARTPQLRVDGMLATSTNGWIVALGDPTPEGGTNLEEALKLGYSTCARHFLAGGVNRVVLLTDGAANLGDVSAEALTSAVASARQRGMALDCFGVGWEGFNDEMLATLSRHGDGRYGFVNSEEDATTEFAARLAGALRVAASDVKVQVEFNPRRVKVWRQLGYAKHQLTTQQFRDNTVDAAELGAAEAGQALYSVQVNESGSGPIGTARVRYRLPDTDRYVEREWEIPYERNTLALERAPASLRLAASAGAFAEWLARNPFAEQVTLDRLLSLMADVPAALHPDPRPQLLQRMLQQAKALAGSAGR